jgi:carnitine O-acetyltransferase
VVQVESAALMVCLDHDCPNDEGVAGAGERARQMWHGDGVNRFYDKTLQFVVTPDGHAGFLGEHALADGAPTSRLCSDVASHARSSLGSLTESSLALLSAAESGVHEVVWEGLEQMEDAVAAAKGAFDEEAAGHQTARVAVPIGSDAIKKLAVGPDAFCQLALQVSFARSLARVLSFSP